VWLGNSYLTVWFPRIYNLSEDNVSSIANMGLWDSFFGIWNFIEKSLGGRGIIVFNSLFDKVSEVELSSEVVDKLIWKMGCIQSNHV
jgi:hypothetical protein